MRTADTYSNAEFINDCLDVFAKHPGNIAVVPGIGSVVMYEEPLVGFASADDEIFSTFKKKEVVGKNHFLPSEWLPEAKTVISFFLPFTDTVRESNKSDPAEPSAEWLYARIEGQQFIGQFMKDIAAMLEEKGIRTCVPALDERFEVKIEPGLEGLKPTFHADSRWSERHAAYACGLGTFGLSRGLISEKGMAGRYASIIVSAELEPTVRPYTGVYDYCIKCGACIRKCPAGAISLKHGKNNLTCHKHVEKMKAKYSPRYGCGKCQVGVPCEHTNPLRRASK
ncbi:MAG: epoxyqueuosine reductase [Mogibacterium sp.]|nr:epoxyqueuosine reductase [Mogibacterium sp.]